MIANFNLKRSIWNPWSYKAGGTYWNISDPQFFVHFLGLMWGLANSSVSDSNHTLRPLLIWYHCDRDADCINSSSIVPAEIAMNKMRQSYHWERETHIYIYYIIYQQTWLIWYSLDLFLGGRKSTELPIIFKRHWPIFGQSAHFLQVRYLVDFAWLPAVWNLSHRRHRKWGNYPWSSPWSVWRTQRTRWPSGCCCGKWWDSFFRSFQPGVEALVTKDGFERSL